ncbi:hypothetical protein HID58_051590 [Brassica napus]|uniref:K-box domain-containing protein n=1 Tax=Brassica napus TaxID=3708 RepID=A0ABQ8AAK2_BRANA|nr:hypothetical protein HID58_051590 [Brassica napus]
MKKTIKRYAEYKGEYFVAESHPTEQYVQLMGKSVAFCSLQEQKEIATQIEKSLHIVRSRKAKLYEDEVEKLKAKERELKDERVRLSGRVGEEPSGMPSGSKEKEDVETDLSIGFPKSRS